MTDGSNTTPPSDPWAQAGRDYWDAWLGFWQQGLRATPPPEPGSAATPEAGPAPPGRVPEWDRFFDDWWRLVSRGAPPSSAEVLQRLADQGKAFLGMIEEYAGIATRSGSPLAPAEWERVFHSALDGWRRSMGFPGGGGATAAFWNLPADTLSRTLSSTSLFPGDYLGALKPEGWNRFRDDVQRNIDRFLSTPGLGYTRESQEQGQDLVRLTLAYQRALQEYLALFARLNVDVVERVSRALAERGEQEQPITTLRGVYDVWVDCSEAAYYELVSTDEYAQVYGRMVNALMALKLHGRRLVDESVGALGLPTRQSLSTLQQRQQELRREIVRLRAQVAQAETDRQAVERLRAELDALRSEVREARRTRPEAGSGEQPTGRPAKAGRPTVKRGD